MLQLDVPFVGTSLTKVTVTGPPQLSDPVTDVMFGAGTWETHWKAAALGQVMEGGVVSLTVNTCEQTPTFPHPSTP